MNDVANSHSNLPAVPEGAWGAQDTSSKDILIPSILLMQDISDLVKQERAKAGSIVNSVTGAILAQRGEKVNIIPVLTFREWEVNELIEQGGKTKEKYVRRVRITAQNEGEPWEFDQDGKSFRQHRTIVVFCLVEGQIDEFPYIIRFKKSSLYAGKKLSTHFQMCGMKRQSPAKQAFGLFGETQTNPSGDSYHAMNVIPSRLTTTEEEAAAFKWWQELSSKDVKVADGEAVPF